MGFRIKLMLAMMLLVACVTAATMYATQKQVESTYERLFQDQFDGDINYFATQQDARLNPIKARCTELASEPDFVKAVQLGDPDAIYSVATNFLNQQASRRSARRTVVVGQSGFLRNSTQSFFRFFNANGEILHPSGFNSSIKPEARKRLEGQLTAVQQSLKSSEEQPLGYLAPERTNGVAQLMEIIITKVSDPDAHATLGALVLGTPLLENRGEKEMHDLTRGEIDGGIWLEHKLHSQTIPDAQRVELSRLIEAHLHDNPRSRAEFKAEVGGVSRRVFLKLLNAGSSFPPAYQVSLYSLASAERTERELRWQMLAFSTAGLAAALLVSLLMAHNFSTPIRELVKATDAVRRGEFKVEVPVRSRDELGRLAVSFNEMAAGLEQKELYRTILNTVADEKIAHALMNGQLALGGELREITVLFCDIRGFTARTENMPPQEVIEMLNEHMTALTRVVKAHNGVLDKFVGDLLMAIFGAPVHHDDDALNAARCAMQLLRERERLNLDSRHRLEIGIGLATGSVVAGCMGSADRLNYTVLGERVNLASRLCAYAAPGKILIDQTTREKLAAEITTTTLPPVTLKGFSENVVVYELISVTDAPA